MTENNDKAYNLYAGFVRRLGAFLIDGVIALILSLIAAQVITFLSIVVLNMLGKSTYNFVMVENYPGVIGNYIPVVIYNLYNSMMDSSKTQATLGKLVTQIKTVDINGMKVPFLNSFLKYLIMWSIPMLFFGRFTLLAIFFMSIPILFTNRKQAIYDMITGIFVVNKDALITAEYNHSS